MPSVVFREKTLSYELGEHEPPGGGKHLLFLPGIAANLQSWEVHLHEQSWRNDTYAVDLPGHGQSSDDPLQSVTQYRDILAEFIQGMAIEPAVLVGHTLGALVAAALAIHAPDTVQALVLVSVYAKWKPPKTYLKELSQALETGTPVEFDASLLSPDVSERVVQWARRQHERLSVETLLSDLSVCGDFDVVKEFPRIKQPTLLVVGDDDTRATVEETTALAESMPHAEVAVIEEAGHLPQVEQARAFERALDEFLAAL